MKSVARKEKKNTKRGKVNVSLGARNPPTCINIISWQQFILRCLVFFYSRAHFEYGKKIEINSIESSLKKNRQHSWIFSNTKESEAAADSVLGAYGQQAYPNEQSAALNVNVQ